MGKKIVDFPPYLNPTPQDSLAIWDSTHSLTKNISLSVLEQFLLAQQGAQGSTGQIGWQYKTTDFSISSLPAKFLIANSSNINITLSTSPNPGDEFDLVLLSTGKVYLNNISILNGVSVQQNNQIIVSTNANTLIQLIYVNSTLGWVSTPLSSVSIYTPLNLPTSGLIQSFFAGAITGVNSGGYIAQWNDTVSAKNATQSITANQPNLVSNVFGIFPSVYFSGNQYFSTDLTYLNGVKYTIAIVEARVSVNSNNNYFIGMDNSSTNQALHVGYRSDTTFTLAQFSNDLNFSVSGYTSFKPNIWIVSNNSRGKEIWQNGNKIASSADTNNLSSGSNGRLGRALNSNCIAHLGLVAIYTGDKSISDIAAIFAAINSTFLIY